MGHGDPPPATAKDFAALYDEEFDYVWHTLRRMGAHDADLADLAHDVFVVVHRRLPDYDPTRPVRPWLFGIAYRVLSDERRRGRSGEIPSESIEVADPGATADDALAAREERAILLAVLATLPIDLRAVLVLHDLEEVLAAEIAAALEIPRNTVYSRLRRAREAFAAAADRARARGGRP